jgi:hypothetical protein
MGTLTFDFAFIENSLMHGEFLTEVHRSCNDAKIVKVNHHYKSKTNTVFLSVSVPEDIATVLKLRFGQCIVVRPPPRDDEDDYMKSAMKAKYMKILDDEYRFERAKIRESYVFQDYISTLALGTAKAAEDKKMISDECYEEMKKMAKSVGPFDPK